MPDTLELRRPRGRPPSTRGAVSAPVQSLDRALGLMELIAEADGLTLTEVAQRAGVAPSTAHRILTTLETHEYVTHDAASGLWLIGVKAFQVGSAFLRNRKLVDAGRGEMRKLMETTGESVNLAVEDGGGIVFVSQIESHHPIRAFHRPGSRGTIHASGVGKVLLASRTEAEVRNLLHKTGLPRFTHKTLVDAGKFLQELRTVRTRGWAIDDEERLSGMRCVAAAIYNEHGEAVAGVSVSGPTERMSHERIGELGPLVRRACDEITHSIGGRAPGRERREE